jgi:hypothetical protein
VNRVIIRTAAVLACFIANAAFAQHSYIELDADGNMVISGPFDAVIPKPEGARIGKPEHSTPSFMSEDLKLSKAGYFADDQFVMVQVETTNAGRGTLTNVNLPVYVLAGEDFRARTACIDISQEELDSDDDPLFEFVENQNVQIVPAVNAVELVVTTDDGTGEGKILYMRNVPGGCDALTPEFEDEFKGAFERFIDSIRSAN